MLKNEDIVFISHHPWGDLWRRRHQIMSRLAGKNRVLFVEPPVSIYTPWKRRPAQHNKQVENLFVLPTTNILPFNRFRFIDSINRKFVLFQIKRMIEKMKISTPILWHCFNDYLWDFTGCFGERLVVYDCYDKFTGIGGGWRDKGRIEKWEKRIVSKADVLFAVSPMLQEHLRQYRQDVHLVTNGVDESFFAVERSGSLPSEATLLSHIPKPIIGYIGSITYKVDYRTLISIAEKKPEWSLVLMGPVNISVSDRQDFAALKALPNVYFINSVPPEQVPAYVQNIDVCLQPYKSFEQIDYCSFPNKFWEYMAAGKPIVTVRLSGMEEYEKAGLIKIADTSDQFIVGISAALDNETVQLAEKRRQMARNNTWSKRVEQMEKHICERLLETNQLQESART